MTATPQTIRWTEHVSINSRFQRSVHLERDADEPAWLTGYVVTPLVRSLTSRIGSGLAEGQTDRAWSLTGPYGSGKTAFALFLSHLLSANHAAKPARKLLAKADPQLHELLFGRRGILRGKQGLIPVRATGERRPLEQLLLEGLQHAAEEFWAGPGRKPVVLDELEEALDEARAGRPLPTGDVVGLFEEVADRVAQSNRKGHGLLVQLDEAGKSLEFAARHPTDGDIHLLQELAEAASRSGDTPIVFMVTLHQAFAHYAGQLSTLKRNEWAKVQGRFEDLPFQEASDQVLRLIGAAITCPTIPRARRRECERHIKATLEAVTTQSKTDWSTHLHATLPLHPVTAIALGPVFRSRLAQNERSLFAFLAATEPKGFQEFLASPAGDDANPLLYTVDRLYDYIQHTYGPRLYGQQGRHWAQVEAAIRRLPADATKLDHRLIKTIGLLAALSDRDGLKASPDLIRAALCDLKISKRAINRSLNRLRQAGLLVYRKYRDAYQLWEGSDLDIDRLVNDALQLDETRSSAAQRLAKIAPPRPAIARRHLFETGTLRFFDVRYTDETVLHESPALPSQADGCVSFVIPTSDQATDELRNALSEQAQWLTKREESARPELIGVPASAPKLRELSAELAAIEWVQTHTPELRDDPAARRELETRRTEAERVLREELASVLYGQGECEWHYQGRQLPVDSGRKLASVLSSICDEVYSQAPIIHNELLNRGHLSSAAAAARRTLMSAMVERSEQPALGIQGYPPEMSMYRSLLEAHGLHRRSRAGWRFAPPRGNQPGSLQPVWRELKRTVEQSEHERVGLPTIYHRLARPPYGLKRGVIPVLFVALLKQAETEIALYEDATFVPAVSPPVIERLLRAPDRFEVQQFRIRGARAALFGKLAAALNVGANGTEPSVLHIVRHLVRFVTALPEFSRNTRTISERAQAVREAVLRAREPAPLLFRDLPKACGLDPIKASGHQANATADDFVERLQDALTELEQAFSQGLSNIQRSLAEAFGLPSEAESARRELSIRAQNLLPIAVDTKLKGFLVRASDDALAHDEWLVSLATLLGGKPPESWRDHDLEHANATLGMLRNRFNALEAIIVDHEGQQLPDGTTLLRMSVAQPGAHQRERVVAVRNSDEGLLRSLQEEIRSVVTAGSADLQRDAILACLALVARDLISDLDAEEEPSRREPTP